MPIRLVVKVIGISGASGVAYGVRALEVLRTKVQQNPPKKHGLMPT